MGRSLMESRGWYRSMARDCMRAAQFARTVELRTELIAQAATWNRLADEPHGYGDQAHGDQADGYSQATGGTTALSGREASRPATTPGRTDS